MFAFSEGARVVEYLQLMKFNRCRVREAEYAGFEGMICRYGGQQRFSYL